MKHSAEAYLVDILKSIDKLERFTNNLNGSYELQADEEKFEAVQRRLSIVGEAVFAMRSKLGVEVSFITSAKKIEGMRHMLVHDYDTMDAATAFNIIRRHLPLLKTEVEEELKRRGAQIHNDGFDPIN